jgi:hypothetical protein
MAMPIIPVPPYVTAPIASGVPSVIRNPSIPSVSTPVPATVEANMPEPATQARWGIFDQSGAPIVTPDTVVGFAYRNEYRVSDYPQEQGAFASYNKVANPFDARIRMSIGRTDNERQWFLLALQTAFQSTNLYSVVTPEFTFPSAAIVHMDYRRERQDGANMLTVDVWVREVRLTGTASFSNTKTASGADAQSQGSVQATTAQGEQKAAVSQTGGASGTW